MVGLKRLGTETINKYNYSETKKKVDRFMEPLYELAFKYRHISPPSVSPTIKEVCVQSSRNNTSKTEIYVMKKIDTEQKVKEYYDAIQEIINILRPDEKLCFKAEYLEDLTIEELAEKLNCSTTTIIQIKKSCIIKFAIALNLAVLKEV